MDALGELTDSKVEECQGYIADKLAEVSGWIDDKIEWAQSIHDEDWRIEICDELKAFKADIADHLQSKEDRARMDASDAIDTLKDVLDNVRGTFEGLNDAALEDFDAFAEGLAADSGDKAQDATDALNEAVDEALEEVCDAKDDAEEEFAFWLKDTYGDTPFPDDVYEDFDPTIDYTVPPYAPSPDMLIDGDEAGPASPDLPYEAPGAGAGIIGTDLPTPVNGETNPDGPGGVAPPGFDEMMALLYGFDYYEPGDLV